MTHRVPYPWQVPAWQSLTAAQQQDRLTHAFLLHGPSGLGKKDFALAWAAHLLCDRQEVTAACGHCPSCHWFQADSHPDFFRVAVEEGSQFIKIDQVRQLIDRLATTVHHSLFQVVLFESADKMHRAAADALLKMLEEPPTGVIILLIAEQVSMLPATLISRCQRIPFVCIASNETVAWVKSKISPNIDPLLLLKSADYAPFQALQHVESDYFAQRDRLLEYLLHISQRKIDVISPAADGLDKNLPSVLVMLMHIIADLIRLKHGFDIEALVYSDRRSELQALAAVHDRQALHTYFQSCQRHLAKVRNVVSLNARLLLESVFIDYARCCGCVSEYSEE